MVSLSAENMNRKLHFVVWRRELCWLIVVLSVALVQLRIGLLTHTLFWGGGDAGDEVSPGNSVLDALCLLGLCKVGWRDCCSKTIIRQWCIADANENLVGRAKRS